MRLVVLTLSVPAMFVAAGLSTLMYPKCGLATSVVAGYLVSLPAVYYAGPIRLRLRYSPMPFA